MTPSVRAFSTALYLLPPAFRREFGAEMTADFTDALSDAELCGSRVALWLGAIGDVLRSAPRLWLESGLPLIALAAAFWGFIVATTAARLPPSELPLPASGDDDLRVLILLVAVVLVVIANTLIVSIWFLRPLLTRDRKLAPCSKRGV